jgi:hypothetical protein
MSVVFTGKSEILMKVKFKNSLKTPDVLSEVVSRRPKHAMAKRENAPLKPG